jgi:hypothetical protein
MMACAGFICSGDRRFRLEFTIYPFKLFKLMEFFFTDILFDSSTFSQRKKVFIIFL